ncbi:MAG: extracellular solute-binding protein [Oscillatoriales cyanobacterium SM2_2_1]|nr:extracellular solute-binding protein [Oscillatoriales cyanobacterium SM2_2_1]
MGRNGAQNFGGDRHRWAPDVVNLNPQFAAKLAERNALLNLTERVTAAEQAAFFPKIWQANQLGAVTFGLPWYVAVDVMFCNRALLEQANLSRPPQSYGESLIRAGMALRDRTGKFLLMLTMDGGQVLESLVQMGMELVDAQGKAAFNTPAGQMGFDLWVELFQKELVPREVLTEGHRRALERYQAGELALLITGPQFAQSIIDNAPQVAKDTVVMPQLVGANGLSSAAVMNVTVPARSPQSDLAVEFALFLTNANNQLAFCQTGNLLPSTVETSRNSFFRNQNSPSDITDLARLTSAAQLPRSTVLVPPIANLDTLRQILYEELQLAMLGQKSSVEALGTAATRWNDRV